MCDELDLTWSEAVLHVLGAHYPDKVSLSVIYYEVHKYRKLTEWHQEDIGYREPRYQQIVRATLSWLVKEGHVERLHRGVYVLRE
jgi:predicted transcriptional regulator of viral defense system